jgi:hypothetical protein
MVTGPVLESSLTRITAGGTPEGSIIGHAFPLCIIADNDKFLRQTE